MFRTSLPYFANALPVYTTTTYDTLGRVTDIDRPDGSAVHRRYGVDTGQHLAITTTTETVLDHNGAVVNSKAHISRSHYSGDLHSTTDAVGTPEEVSTHFDYYGTGLPKTIHVNTEQVARFEYNAAGHRTLLSDANVGTINTQYTALGQVRWQQDSAGNNGLRFTRPTHHRGHTCRACDSAPETATMPPQLLPKSQASAGFMAYVVTSKYADAIPVYRQCHMLNRAGLDVQRHTLCQQVVKAGECMQPLINLLIDHALSYPILQMDETPLQVLNEPGRKAQSKSYMWVMHGGPPQQRSVVYHYDPGRGQAVVKRLLEGCKAMVGMRMKRCTMMTSSELLVGRM